MGVLEISRAVDENDRFAVVARSGDTFREFVLR
jgi:hypothetical protein